MQRLCLCIIYYWRAIWWDGERILQKQYTVEGDKNGQFSWKGSRILNAFHPCKNREYLAFITLT